MAVVHPDLAAEQAYIDRAYACLEAMKAKTAEATADAKSQAKDDWNAAVALAHLTDRLESMNTGRFRQSGAKVVQY